MTAAVNRGYLIAAVVLVVGVPAAWYFFPRSALDTGRLLAQRGDGDGALRVWMRGCKRGEVESCAAAALLELQHARIPEATALVDQAKAADPDHVWSMILTGRLLEIEGKTAEAQAVYEKAEAAHPNSALPPASLAKLALDRGDLAEAERCAERAIAAEPGQGSGYAMRGRVLVATSSYQEAMSTYADAIERNGMTAQDWVLLAEVFTKMGRPEDRLEVLEDGNRRNPDDPALLTALGIERVKHDDVDRGIEALRRACDLSPLAEPRVFLGITFLEMARPDWAAQRFEEALKISPDDLDVKHLLATARANAGETEVALKLMEEILARPDLTRDQRIRTLFLRARFQEAAGNAKESMADVKELLRLDPDLPDANWLCGHLELAAGRDEEAQACLVKAMTPEGTTEIAVLKDMARLTARIGSEEEAIRYLETLIALRAIDETWIKANPEFRKLGKIERFRLMLEGAPPPTDGFEPAP